VSSRIGLAGGSLGANLVALHAAADASIVSVALLSPSLDYRGLRIEAAVRKYGSRPMLLVVSDEDAYARRSADELKGTGGGIRELLTLSGAGHGTNMLGRAPELGSALVAWFQRTLQ
jgi:acetyl esterase/lipase